MFFSIQLFNHTYISLGLAANLANYRLKSIRELSPDETRLTSKSQCRVGWAPRAHQTLGAATMVGRGLPTPRTATTL